MRIPLYQVDAFTSKPFTGNPAAICPLESWLDAGTLQAIAAENNVSETAFFVEASPANYELRWFTPTTEVDLCGHATLASAFVLFNWLGVAEDAIRFNTRSRTLTVIRQDGRLAMDFPSRPPMACDVHPELLPALGVQPELVLGARDYFVVLDSEEAVRAVQPDFARLSKLDRFAVIITALGRDCDFVSRFFAPAQGVPEDPVTGSAHCTLAPYWSKRLNKSSLFARQVSSRGGELWCEDRADRVVIGGEAVLVAKGEMFLSGIHA